MADVSTFAIFVEKENDRMDYKTSAENVYLYSYPLVLTELIHWGANDKEFEHCREFPTEKDVRVTKLNNDTLYSYGWTQLAKTPYLIHIPKITERYYLFPIMDAYSNVIYSIGTRTPQQSDGDYILLYKDEPVPAGYESYRVLRSQDSLNSVLLRIETRGKDDYPFVNQLQNQITMTPLYPEKVEKVPSGDGIIPVTYIEKLSGQEYFSLFAKLVAENEIKDEAIKKDFARLGYDFEKKNWDYHNLSEEQKNALEEGSKSAYEKMILQEGKHEDVLEQHGWTTIYGNVGVFQKNYLERAAVNRNGWGGNIVQDTLYTTAYTDTDGNWLSGEKDYVLHFEADEFPPAAIFWSVTLYGFESRFHVQNEINRFSVNSHDVKNGEVLLNEDGSLDIYISRKKPSDVKKAQNWLPAPQKESRFSLAIRNYWPLEKALQRKWNPPLIQETEW
jgi:hypothetical protein